MVVVANARATNSPEVDNADSGCKVINQVGSKQSPQSRTIIKPRKSLYPMYVSEPTTQIFETHTYKPKENTIPANPIIHLLVAFHMCSIVNQPIINKRRLHSIDTEKFVGLSGGRGEQQKVSLRLRSNWEHSLSRFPIWRGSYPSVDVFYSTKHRLGVHWKGVSKISMEQPNIESRPVNSSSI